MSGDDRLASACACWVWSLSGPVLLGPDLAALGVLPALWAGWLLLGLMREHRRPR